MKFKCTKNNIPFYKEMPHFPFESMWEDFISTLNMDDKNIKLLVDEVEYYRKKAGEYYQYYIDASL